MAKNNTTQLVNYKPIEAFVQLNFLDGYSYIDKAGEILNSFVREKKEIPKFNMNIEGLVISDLDASISEIKVTPNMIWIHFVEPKNVGNIVTESSKYFDKIIKILKPTLYKRIGWRTYFIREDTTSATNPVKKLKIGKSINKYDFQNLVISKSLNNFQVRLEISPVAHKSKPNQKSLLFDIDLAREVKRYDSSKLEDIKVFMKSDTLLDTVEDLLSND